MRKIVTVLILMISGFNAFTLDKSYSCKKFELTSVDNPNYYEEHINYSFYEPVNGSDDLLKLEALRNLYDVLEENLRDKNALHLINDIIDNTYKEIMTYTPEEWGEDPFLEKYYHILTVNVEWNSNKEQHYSQLFLEIQNRYKMGDGTIKMYYTQSRVNVDWKLFK